MTIGDWELWACAQEMIDRHGPDAPIQAAMKADQMLEKGEFDGERTWRLILHRVNDLLAKAPATRH